MGTTRLKLYNGALLKIGKRGIASLTVNEDSRRLLDEAWDMDAVDYCLAQGLWKFATRSQKLDYDTSIEPEFGLQHGFAKPTDWVATSAVCSDEFYKEPLLRYQDEQHIIYADLDQLYVRFVSNDAAWGQDLARWPASFSEYVQWYLASKIVLKATDDQNLATAIMKPTGGLMDKALALALNNDAQSDPPKFPPPSSWIRARRAGSGDWRDGGSRGRLIG